MVGPFNIDLIPSPQEVGDFYENRNILVTGSSGFLGKLLVEKILRLSPNVNSLFLIIRAKKGKSPETRYEELISDVIFDRLKKENPEFARKIVLIEGDMGQVGLGLSLDHRELIRNTHIILHAAAIVKFTEPIRVAAHINVRGTKELISLAMEMPHLKAFVYVSTAYSQCVRELIEEKFYPPPISADKLLRLTDILDDVALEHLAPVLLGKWPNIYTFTKAVAEDIIHQGCRDLPLCVVRPSIILSTYREPVDGWIVRGFSSIAILYNVAFGIQRSMHCNKNMVIDVIPADYVINSIIVAAWDVDRIRNTNRNDQGTPMAPEAEEFPIYNVVSSCHKPMKWGEMMRHIGNGVKENPSVMCLWYYCLTLNKHLWIHRLCVILLHLLPAAMYDIVAWSVGRKPTMIKMYKNIEARNLIISHFTMNDWRFRHDRTMRMWKSLSPADRTKYDLDISSLNWADYFHCLVRGMRIYLLKDPMETLQKGRAKYAKLKFAHYMLVTILYGVLCWFLWILIRFLIY